MASAGGARGSLLWARGADCLLLLVDEIIEAATPLLVLVSAEPVAAVTKAMTLKQAAPSEHYDDEDVAMLDGILDVLVWLRGERATR